MTGSFLWVTSSVCPRCSPVSELLPFPELTVRRRVRMGPYKEPGLPTPRAPGCQASAVQAGPSHRPWAKAVLLPGAEP